MGGTLLIGPKFSPGLCPIKSFLWRLWACDGACLTAVGGQPTYRIEAPPSPGAAVDCRPYRSLVAPPTRFTPSLPRGCAYSAFLALAPTHGRRGCGRGEARDSGTIPLLCRLQVPSSLCSTYRAPTGVTHRTSRSRAPRRKSS